MNDLNDATSSIRDAVQGTLIEHVPRLEQYEGPLAIYEPAYEAIVSRLATPELLRMHVSSYDADLQARERRGGNPSGQRGGIHGYEVRDDGIATIQFRGTVTKEGGSLSRMPQGTIGVMRAVREAVRDEDVAAIMMEIDSPGGTVAGTAELADALRAAAKAKPVHAYIDDMGASAAYWIASQADRVTANSTAMVGSIGVVMSITDWSQLFAANGAKVHVYRSGPLKATGIRGAPISPAEHTALQGRIDAIASLFRDAVADGRSFDADQVAAVATGDVWIGSGALEVGLIDAVSNLEDAYDQLAKQIFESGTSRSANPAPANGRNPKGTLAMTTKAEDKITDPAADVKTATATPAATAPATASELKADCPKASSDEILGMLEANLTREDSKVEYTRVLEARLATAEDAAEKSKADAAAIADKSKGKASAPEGVDAVEDEKGSSDAGTGTGDAQDRFVAAVDAEKAKGKSPNAAFNAVVRRSPDLHKAYVKELEEAKAALDSD